MLNISAKIQIWLCCTVDLFFGVSGFRFQVSGFRLDGRPLFVETLLGECAVSKANLLAERSLSLVW
ncbi:hypothetical protein D6A02_24745 [Vibrio parahaemolyticus]|nr:hypothetical protein [Vibrio parahaemolyticus]